MYMLGWFDILLAALALALTALPHPGAGLLLGLSYWLIWRWFSRQPPPGRWGADFRRGIFSDKER
jgi:hypothetical protein